MPKDLRELVREHHAFYEVLPYYILWEEKHGSPAARTRTIQAGFDVDLYGARPNKELVPPRADPDYPLGYAGVEETVEEISHHTSGSCSLEVIPFPSRIVLGGPGRALPEGMLRIRISHSRGLGQPAGLPEEQALKELEKQLHDLGFMRGSRSNT